MTNIVLSVCVITYNHVDFIRQAIESTLDQRVNFEYEVIVADDNSNDGTKNICLELKEKYGDRLNLILRDKNIGALPNFYNTFDNCKGKYIALLEGDDYWGDPYKLQKQVDFLERNQDFGLVCTRYMISKGNEPFFEHDHFKKLINEDKGFYEVSVENLLSPFVVKTLTVVFKKELWFACKDKLDINYVKDIYLSAVLLHQSRGAFMNFVSGVYRIHPGGIWSLKSAMEKAKANYLTAVSMDTFFKGKYNSLHQFMLGEEKVLFEQLLNEKNKTKEEKRLFLKIRAKRLLRKFF